MSMGPDCRRLRGRLPDVALGARDPEVEQHLEACRDCRQLADQFVRMHVAGSLPRFEPPGDAVQRAKTLFQPVRRSASLVRSSLAGAGARRAGLDAFQCLFEAEDVRVRVGYSRQGAVWVVQGEVPAQFSHVRHGRRKIAVEAGKFRFEAKSLDRSGFTLVGAREEVEVPPPEVGG